MIRVQVCEEDSLHILPVHLKLRQTLQSAATCIEEKFLLPCLHEGARPESVHGRRR